MPFGPKITPEQAKKIDKAREAYMKFRKNKALAKQAYLKNVLDKVFDAEKGDKKVKGKRESIALEDEKVISSVIDDIFRLKDQILSDQNKTKIDQDSIEIVSGVTHGAIDSMTPAELFTLRSFMKSSNSAIRENSYDDIQSAIKSLGMIVDTTLQSDKVSEDDWVDMNRIKDKLEQIDLDVRKLTKQAEKTGDEPDLSVQFNEVADLIKKIAESLGIKIPSISKIPEQKEEDKEDEDKEDEEDKEPEE